MWRGVGFFVEGEGFEPPVPAKVQRFSRPPQSTALPTFQACCFDGGRIYSTNVPLSITPQDAAPVLFTFVCRIGRFFGGITEFFLLKHRKERFHKPRLLWKKEV